MANSFKTSLVHNHNNGPVRTADRYRRHYYARLAWAARASGLYLAHATEPILRLGAWNSTRSEEALMLVAALGLGNLTAVIFVITQLSRTVRTYILVSHATSPHICTSI